MVPFRSSLLDELDAMGVRYRVVPPPESVNRYGGQVLRDSILRRLQTTMRALWYNWAVRRVLRCEEIDVVYCNGIRALLTVGLAARSCGIPVLWYVKGTLDNPLLDRLGMFLASRILFFSDSNRDDRYGVITRFLGSRVGVLPIGLDISEVDTAAVAPLDEDPGLLRDGVNFAYVGQLYPPKGVHHLIDAFALVARRIPAVRLFLVGDSVIAEYASYVVALREQIHRLGLERQVVLTGWRRDALTLMSRMNVLVHPSLAEGFSRSVLEAMALGLPVVATRVGGLRDAVRDGENGFLVEPAAPAALAERMTQLAQDPSLRTRMGTAARATIVRSHRVEDKMASLQGEFLRLAEGRRRVNRAFTVANV